MASPVRCKDAKPEQEVNMVDYTFDGRVLKERRSAPTVGVLDSKYIRDAKGNRVTKIDGNLFRHSRDNKVAEVYGRNIRDWRGAAIACLEDVKGDIEGIGGLSLVAM
jgi:hypothetical protein